MRLLSSLSPTPAIPPPDTQSSPLASSDQTIPSTVHPITPIIVKQQQQQQQEQQQSSPKLPSFLPAWLRNVLPGGQYLASPSTKPTASSESGPSELANIPSPSNSSIAPPPTEAAVETQAQKMRREYMGYLEKHKDITVDAFIEMTRQMRAESEVPLPTLPPVRRSHPEYKRFVDWKRVSYLRSMQHERIANILTEDEKARVKKEGEAILKDRSFILNVSDRTGVYIDLEVIDCFKSYFETRDRMRRLYRWVVVLGQPEPLTSDMQRLALEEMTSLEDDEERLEKLERQDTIECPILPLLKSMGHDAVCSRTGLKFHQCCGGATGGRPAWMNAKDRAKALEGQRGRFSPRSERSARKMVKERQQAGTWEEI